MCERRTPPVSSQTHMVSLCSLYGRKFFVLSRPVSWGEGGRQEREVLACLATRSGCSARSNTGRCRASCVHICRDVVLVQTTFCI